MDYDSRWIMWIQGCLESATVSVLVNSSPTEEFKPSRGLRQGDPLAPFLFLVVAERACWASKASGEGKSPIWAKNRKKGGRT